LRCLFRELGILNEGSSMVNIKTEICPEGANLKITGINRPVNLVYIF
jgi:hypothetical protein